MLLEGRKQPRTAERYLVQILAVRDALITEVASVENVCSQGARLATERFWEPGSHVLLKSSIGTVKGRARVVYCKPANGKGYAVGLNLLSQISDGDGPGEPPPTKQ